MRALMLILMFVVVSASVSAQDLPSLDQYDCREGRSYLRAMRGQSHTLDRVDAVYQSYNRRFVLLDMDTHDLLRVMQEDVETDHFLGAFTPGCGMFVYQSGRRNYMDTGFFDVQSGTLLQVIPDTLIRRLSVSPSNTYVVYDTSLGSFLLNLHSGERFPLIPTVQHTALGSGDVWSYSHVEWDMINGFVRVITDGSYRDFDLATGTLLRLNHRDGTPYESAMLAALEAQRTSAYGCMFLADYQSFNNRLVLMHWISREVIAVIEENMQVNRWLPDFYRSPDCRYLWGALEENGEVHQVVWDLAAHTRILQESIDSLDSRSYYTFDWSRITPFLSVPYF